jgi:hypothetical protein
MACDLSPGLMGSRLPGFAQWSGYPSIAALLDQSRDRRDGPRADVALSAERHSKHELGPDGVGVAVSIASKI